LRSLEIELVRNAGGATIRVSAGVGKAASVAALVLTTAGATVSAPLVLAKRTLIMWAMVRVKLSASTCRRPVVPPSSIQTKPTTPLELVMGADNSARQPTAFR
jgi:hypothetical protein